jgi:preprotein translocase subunit SecD
MPAPEDKRKLQVVMRFTDESRRDFGDFTARHVNQCARFLVDGNTASGTARILTSITGGYAVLDPILPDQAEQIAQRLSEHPASLAVELAPCQWPAPAPAPGT